MTRYQRYLARKRLKHQGQVPPSTSRPGHRAWQMRWIAMAPVHECLVPVDLFENGLGNLVFSRRLLDGQIAMSVFLLDTFCKGVKDAFWTITPKADYDARLGRQWIGGRLEGMAPGCFRKLVEGGVDYARKLGFAPHPEYEIARQIFGNIDVAACPTTFEYGDDGQPFYISGPHESPTQVRATLDHLERQVGPDNFHFLVKVPDPSWLA
jgi:hypothetical protein